MESKTREIRPQPGPQEAFLRSPADVAIYGGAAGGGKSFALLLDALGYVDDPQYNCVIFRRTSEQLRTAGGLWDEAMNLYPLVGARSRERELDFKFPSGAQVKLDAIQHEKDKEQFQGAQICGIGFDELTHFTESQFTYMFSRNRRPGCKYKPYIKATTNPDASSWVKKWVAPWVDPEHELFPQQYGKVLYFTNFGGSLKFSTEKFSVENPMTHVPEPAKTITFIKAMASDNEILMRNNPGYIAGLLSLNAIDRARLLEGSWTIMEQGNMFGADWFRIIDQMDPEDPVVTRCRYWDMAATEQKSKNDPDYTVGVRMAITKSKRIIVEDVIRIREPRLLSSSA